MGRIIIYGDIHGCLDEWKRLRRKVKAGADDSEISVGDLLSKGPKPLETLRYAEGEGVRVVLGNHEEKYLEIASSERCGDRIEQSKQAMEFYRLLSAADIDFLFKLPRFIRVANLLVVHAGLTNTIDLDRLGDDQRQLLTRLRYVGAGAMEYRFWAELYNGNQGFAVYGHTPGELRRHKYALGIDTGCVYGYKLTAAIFERHGKRLDTENYEIVQVNAEKRYA